jgi:hypothetical protein
METTRQIESVLASEGTQEIGAIVFWTLNDVGVNRLDLYQKLDEIGLAGAVPRTPKPMALLTAAVRKVEHAAVKRQVEASPMSQGRWGLVRKSEGSDGTLSFRHSTTISADDEGVHAKTVGDTDETIDCIVEDIRREWGWQKQNADSRVLSLVLVHSLTGTEASNCLGAVSLRDRAGGVYYVPAPSLPKLRALRKALGVIAPRCTLEILVIHGTRENLESSARAARQSLEGQLAEIRRETEELIARASEDHSEICDYSIRTRVEKFGRLRDRVELFRCVLGDVATEMAAHVKEVGEQLAKEMRAT